MSAVRQEPDARPLVEAQRMIDVQKLWATPRALGNAEANAERISRIRRVTQTDTDVENTPTLKTTR